ncbi:MAG: helix-turn-helix domain-containing protein [Solirubrobacterales bacterium]
MAERSAAHLAFGQTVRAHRTRRHISQEELAARSGLHRTYVSGIERGERNLSLESILKLAEGLEVNPGELFGPAS